MGKKEKTGTKKKKRIKSIWCNSININNYACSNGGMLIIS